MPRHDHLLRGAHYVTIFEASDTYVLNNRASGFWGEVTSSVDWCERNYVVTPYIAEFWNTISNILIFLGGVYGLYRARKSKLETRFYVLFFLIAVIGLGSALFHGTLQHNAQQLDETPMLLCILVS